MHLADSECSTSLSGRDNRGDDTAIFFQLFLLILLTVKTIIVFFMFTLRVSTSMILKLSVS